MIRNIQRRIEKAFQKILEAEFGLSEFSVPEAQYPQPEMGDLSYTFSFPLAKTLRKAPKVIAQQIIDRFPQAEFPEIASLEIGGAGYLNFRLNRALVSRQLWKNPVAPDALREDRAIVEHTNINPNKAAHVGHLRNAVLGDTLVRMLRFNGIPVEVQNYIDDTGVQLADVVVGFQRAGKTAADLDSLPGRLDYYFWDLYAETHHWLETSPENKKHREQVLKAMEEHQEPIFSLSQEIARRIIACHLATMLRLGVSYQLLPRESDILGLRFWARTFDLLKEKSAIVEVQEGKNKGCWVMRLGHSEEFEDMQNPDKVIVRSNGIVTYVGKDIAYQLWKFGLLGLDFQYKVFQTNPDGSILWQTATTGGDPSAPHFGGAHTVYNVIDQRQSYLQKVVAEGLRALGYHEQAERSIHFSYEMVTLSPKTAKMLGFELSAEEQEKTFVEMSGRKGIGVKADDLMDRLRDSALQRVTDLFKDLPLAESKDLAANIATAALRYFMIRYTRNTIINFDMEEALSFEGETGPYLQYSMVRARSILRKLKESGFDPDSNTAEEYARVLGLMSDTADAESVDSWGMLTEILKTPDIVTRSLRSLELSLFAKHVFELARSFNNYYHKYPVLHERNSERRLLRVAVVRMFEQGMRTNLDLLGIPVPERM